MRARSERFAVCVTDLPTPIAVFSLLSSMIAELDADILLSTKSVKYWERIADNLSKAGWSWGCVSAIDSNGRTI
jgi:hypothetical protein